MEPKTKSTALVATAMMQFKKSTKPSLLAVGDTAFATIELSATPERRQSCIKEAENSLVNNLDGNNRKDGVFESSAMDKKAINAEE